jgi:hypothetical protein
MRNRLCARLAAIAVIFSFAQAAAAQNINQPATDGGKKNGAAEETSGAALIEELRRMRQTIDRLEARVSQLEAERLTAASEKLWGRFPTCPTTGRQAEQVGNLPHQSSLFPGGANYMSDSSEKTATASQATISEPSQPDAVQSVAAGAAPGAQKLSLTTDDRDTLDFWRDTTVNVVVDGYYGYNFNRPLGGINLLRAYDVLSNSFSLNQAGVVFEQEPNVEEGRRFGARLDLMFGQATETVQGSAVNELRPQVYRHVWQAYGSYVAPLGNGLRVDFGKFASSLGYETNYTKDNFNYSRPYFFLFLPFYHLGFRAKYPVNDKLTVLYHLVNGIQQSEDFNGFKSQHVALIVTPNKRVSTQVNYYAGREQRVRTSILNPTFPVLPTQPGLSPVEIRPVQNGRFHVLDAYATFKLTDRMTLAFEGDYVINRTFENSPPSGVWGGVAYARYQFSPGFALASRFEYMSDKLSDSGLSLFSGLDQALKEVTLTAQYKFGEGFMLFGEYRRDWSNQPFFLTDTPGVLKKEQNTATLGLVWWFGRKKGSW